MVVYDGKSVKDTVLEGTAREESGKLGSAEAGLLQAMGFFTVDA